MKLFMYAIVCEEVDEGKKKEYCLFDEFYPVMAKDEKDAMAKALLACAGDLEEVQETCDVEGKEFSFEVLVRPF